MANNKDNSADARAAAKAKAQQQVKSGERRTTVIIVAVCLVVIAAFAGIVYFIVNSSKVPALADAHAPAPAEATTGGIPVGATGVAGEGLTDGAVRLDIYIDLMCPVCNQFEQINGADIDELREAGTINVYYHPISILDRASMGTEYSTRAANAVGVVADQDPSHFLDVIAALYANQPEENTTALSDDEIAAVAIGAGVPADVANSFAKGEFTKWVTAATQQASIDGMQGTPTVMVNREILDPNQVNYFTPGTLKAYLEQLGGTDSSASS